MKISVPENSHSQRIKGASERKEIDVWLKCHVLGRIQKRESQAIGPWDWVSGCGCPKSSLQMSLEASLKEALYSESSALLPVMSSSTAPNSCWAPQGQTQAQYRHSRPGGRNSLCAFGVGQGADRIPPSKYPVLTQPFLGLTDGPSQRGLST